VSQIGDRIHTLAVIWLVYSWTKSGTALGIVLIAATLPSVLISPWAGAVSDRLNRKHIAIACDITRCVLVFALAGMAHYNLLNMPVITAMTALISIASSFFNPATLAMLPSIISSKDLARGNAITQLSANASGALGFLLGSGLMALSEKLVETILREKPVIAANLASGVIARPEVTVLFPGELPRNPRTGKIKRVIEERHAG
jgi:MFS transporter, DHA3 family, macrolide efflux protein